MRRLSLKRTFLELTRGGKIEMLLGLVVIAGSSMLPAFTANNLLTQLSVFATIPLLLPRYPVSLIPMCVTGYLWVSGFADNVLFSGFIVYLALEYAAAVGRRAIVAILAAQWLFLAYFIAAEGPPTADDAPAIMLECLFILMAVSVGQFRYAVTRERWRRAAAHRQVEQELRSGLARYLHDSVARSLTMMSMQAEIAKMHVTDVDTRRQLEAIAMTGRAATKDLQQLVDHLIDTNPRDGADMLGLWNTASIGETIGSAATLLEEADYQVTVKNIDPSQRSSRIAETAFALAFNEVTANLVKHSPRSGPVTIAAYERGQCVDVEVINTRRDDAFAEKEIRQGGGVGLASVKTRMHEVGGSAEISITPDCWQVTLSTPLEND